MRWEWLGALHPFQRKYRALVGSRGDVPCLRQGLLWLQSWSEARPGAAVCTASPRPAHPPALPPHHQYQSWAPPRPECTGISKDVQSPMQPSHAGLVSAAGPRSQPGAQPSEPTACFA